MGMNYLPRTVALMAGQEDLAHAFPRQRLPCGLICRPLLYAGCLWGVRQCSRLCALPDQGTGLETPGDEEEEQPAVLRADIYTCHLPCAATVLGTRGPPGMLTSSCQGSALAVPSS